MEPPLEVDFEDTAPAAGRNGTSPVGAPLVARPLTDFNLLARDDPSILLGNRYLSRGDGAILSSTSGMGKSSLSIQAAVSWARGLPLFGGLDPHGRKLRSLIFQSEDSDGDVAEVRHSIFHAEKMDAAEQAEVGERVKIVTDRIHRGASFHTELKRQVELHKPDIVWINPLLAFIGGDVNDAEAAGSFLREGLNSLNDPPRFAYIIVHHTSKPPKEKTDRKWNEVMYDMAGSADLTNWARAIISLRPADKQGNFNLVFAKRGVRAGYTKLEERTGGIKWPVPTTTIGIRHSGERMTVDGQEMGVIYWQACELSEETQTKSNAGRKKSVVFSDVAEAFAIGQSAATGFRVIHRAAKEIRPNIGVSAMIRVIDEAVEDGVLCLDKTNPKSPKYFVPKG